MKLGGRGKRIAELDKPRPVLVLTREIVRPHLARVTVAPVTTTARGLSTDCRSGSRTAWQAHAS